MKVKAIIKLPPRKTEIVWSEDKIQCVEDTNLGCADPSGSGEGPFPGVVGACWCPSWIHSGRRLQSPCHVSRPWAETHKGHPLDTSLR